MVSFHTTRIPKSTMNAKTDDSISVLENGIMKTYSLPETDNSDTPSTLDDDDTESAFPQTEVQPKVDDWIDVDTPSHSRERHESDHGFRVVNGVPLKTSTTQAPLAFRPTAISAMLREIQLEEEQIAAKEYEKIKTATELTCHEEMSIQHKAMIAGLTARVAELEEVSKLIEHTEAVKHIPDHPLIMRIAVWVGGEKGTDVELALVKMNPDTPFKIVLENLRQQHPLKALKQNSTGRYIFDSDTPASLGFKDGEELVFIQQSDEPMFMLDATMDGAECWRGNDSRISWGESEKSW